jgi:biopolymer transport protein ExbD
MIRFKCEQCGKSLKATPEQAGAKFKCSGCGAVGRVPRWTDEVGREDADRAAKVAASTWRATDEEHEPIKIKRRTQPDAELDMTPMVDCVFQLLIFFMVTASFAVQKAFEVPKPDSPDTVAQQRTPDEPEKDDDFIIVRIDQENLVWIDDREVPTRQELIARVRQAREESPGAPQGLLVSAHPDAQHATVVMCCDVAQLLKVSNIKVKVEEREM